MLKWMSRVAIGALAGGMALADSLPSAGAAAAGQKLFQARCASCHAVEVKESDDYVELANRKGPSLAYAGSKFNPEFLRKWLSAPAPIRPAGYLSFRHVVTTPQGDRVDPQKIEPHLRLSEAEAASVSGYLQTLRKETNQYPLADPNVDIDPAVHFSKVLGCASCHQATPGAGGLSGPELYTAKARLSKEWVRALVADPVYWGPMPMPKPSIRSDQLAAITEYLFSAGGETAPSAAAQPAKHTDETARPSGRVETIYQIFCSQCHGVTGNGKGINSATMFVSPRNHTSSQEMGALTDDRLYAVIRYGGPAVGKSVLMPSWGATLKDADIRLLVGYLRELSGTQARAAGPAATAGM
jgi:cytochrome c oxidase cbb3-type subunit 3